MTQPSIGPNGKDKILWQAPAIAAYVGRDIRTVYALLQRGELPAVKIGRRWMTTEERLDAFIREALGCAQQPNRE